MAGTRKKQGFGSIRKLPSGRYQVRYTHPLTRQRITGSKTYQNKAAAELALSEIRKQIDAGTLSPDAGIEKLPGDIDPKGMTLAQLGAHWRPLRLTKRGQPLSPNTLTGYQKYVEIVMADLANLPIQAITPARVEAWFTSPKSRATPNQSSKAYSHLVSLMKYAAKKKWIAENPCDIPGASNYEPDKPVEVQTLKQTQILLDAAQGDLKVIIALGAWGGMRKGEILALRRSDITIEEIDGERVAWIDVNKGIIWLDGQAVERPPKWQSIRVVGLPPEATEILEAHLKTIPINPDALLFVKKPGSTEHYGRLQLDRQWQKHRTLAGFYGRFHSFRAFGQTEFGKTGASIIEIMNRGGNRDVKTAMRYQRTTGRERDLIRQLGKNATPNRQSK